MAKITNIGKTAIRIAKKKLEPNGSLDYEGTIPKSLFVLERLGALEIEGVDEEDRVDVSSKIVVSNIKNPKQDTKKEPNADQVSLENDAKIVAVMKELPKEALMADGRPEVRAVNEKLKELGVNNITAEDRDRLWEQAQKAN